MGKPAMGSCRAKGCANKVHAVGASLCTACVTELNRLLVAGLSDQLGRLATDDDVEQLLRRIEARRPQ